MNMRIPTFIREIKPYVAGKPIEELEREYGISDSIKLASNENPLGPSPLAVKAIGDVLARLNRYPDAGGYELISRLAQHLGVPRNCIVIGNGSDDIIGMMTRSLLEAGDEVLLPYPSFLMYEISVRSVGAKPVMVPLKMLAIDLEAIRKRVTPETRMVFLCNPNNPTGTLITHGEFSDFLSAIPKDLVVVLDEAYMEFVRNPDRADGMAWLDTERPVVTLRTFSKAYGLAGLRIGYGIMPSAMAEVLNRIRQPFNASLPAQVGACAALEDTDFLQRTLETIHEGVDFLQGALDAMGVKCFPTEANFFLIDMGISADLTFQKLLEKGVIVRSMSSYGYPEYIRINAGTQAENKRFVEALKQVLAEI